MRKDQRKYLDTSSIRRLGGRILTLPKPHHFRTSAFSLVELLNGIDESDAEFSRRSVAIKRVLDSGIFILWQLPQELLAASFDEVDVYVGRVEQFQAVIESVIAAADRKQLISDLSAAGKIEAFRYFKDYDQHIGNIGVSERNTTIRDAINAEKARPDSPFDPAKLASGFVAVGEDLMSDQKYLSESGRRSISRWLAKNLANSSSELVSTKIYNSYNYKAECFIKACSASAVADLIAGGSRKRNDIADLLHFLYLSKNTTLVTDDTGMSRVAAKIGVETHSTTDILKSATVQVGRP